MRKQINDLSNEADQNLILWKQRLHYVYYVNSNSSEENSTIFLNKNLAVYINFFVMKTDLSQ